VQFTHAGNNGLTRLFVGAHAEGWILLSQTTQRHTHLFLVSLGLRLNGNVNHRLRENHTLKGNDFFGSHSVSPVVASFNPRCSDVASTHFLDFFTLIGVHLQNATQTLLATLNRVV
jgi:hypothetical protein